MVCYKPTNKRLTTWVINLWVLITSKGITGCYADVATVDHYGNNIHGGGISVFIEVMLIGYINGLSH